MEVRPATVDDVPAVLPLVAKTNAFHERLDPAKYPFIPDVAMGYGPWLRSRARDRKSVFLVADAGEGRIVGFLVATTEKEIPIYRVEEYGFIQDLWVDEDYRHEGVGRQLVTLAIEKFAETGVKQMRLDVGHKNGPARKLFESCGLRPSVVEMLIEIPDMQGKNQP